MGGKSYFCDYCGCFLRNDVNVRKIHNAGLPHKIAKANYLKQFQDPRDTYKEEISKTSCSRYFKGLCKFDSFCQFSHYTARQLSELKEIVKKLDNGSYQIVKDVKKQRAFSKRKQKIKNLPASLRAMQTQQNAITLFEWG